MERYNSLPDSDSNFKAEVSEVIAAQESTESKRFLMTTFHFIGDAVLTLCGVEQIRKVSPESEIEVLCTPLQAELLSDDSRINQLFPVLEPYPAGTPLRKRLKEPNTTVPDLRQVLRKRRYQAVFPGNMTIPFDRDLGAKIMRPHLFPFATDLRRLKKLEDRPMGYLIRKTINQFFGVEEDPNINERTRLFLSSNGWIKQRRQ